MHYENRMSKPAWQQQTVDERGQTIYQPFSKPGVVDLKRTFGSSPTDKRWRLSLARRKLALSLATR